MRQTTESHRSTFHCPRCGRLISYNAHHCLYCKLPRPGMIARLPVLSDMLRGQVRFGEGIFLTCFALYMTAILLDISGSVATGGLFGISRERVRQIEAKALRKLRHPTRSRKLRDYLT